MTSVVAEIGTQSYDGAYNITINANIWIIKALTFSPVAVVSPTSFVLQCSRTGVTETRELSCQLWKLDPGWSNLTLVADGAAFRPVSGTWVTSALTLYEALDPGSSYAIGYRARGTDPTWNRYITRGLYAGSPVTGFAHGIASDATTATPGT